MESYVYLLDMVLKEGEEDSTTEQFIVLVSQPAVLSHSTIEKKSKREGSHPRRAANFNREFQSGHDRIYKDYFSDNHVYRAFFFQAQVPNET